MATPSGRAHKAEADLGDPDLIPIMSIMCILIPVLIFSFTMFEVKVQEISLPKFGGPSSGAKSKVLNLALLVDRDQFIIKIQGGGKEAKEITIKKRKFKNCPSEVSCDECVGETYEDYDYPGLYTTMVKLKDSKDFAEVDSINIGAENRVQWKVLARTIAAVRVKLDKPKFETICEYSRAAALKVKTTDADGKEVEKPAEMFPKIVFVML